MNAKALILGGLLSLGSFSAAVAATCSTTVTTSDGREVKVEVSGDTCTWDLKTNICTCT